jgi:outer membrane immunogenic protein
MRRVLLASTAAIAMVAGAQAADLGAPRAAIAAAVVAPDQWSGFYAGLHAGYGFGRSRIPASLVIGAPLDHSFNGALLGGQFGWNHQIGRLVLGLEATLAYAGLSGSVDAGIAGAAMRTDAKWLTTMGPRLGFAYDRALIYAKGGFAAAGFSSGLVAPGLGDFRGAFVRTGWFLGAGIEYALASNWSIRAEYNYLNFGTGYSTLQGLGFASVGTASTLDAHVVTIGLNYRFGGARPAPEAAGAAVPVWTGFYAGLHAGYSAGQATYDPALALGLDHSYRGALAGAQFGWNQQFGQVVAGFEATLAYAGLTGGREIGGFAGMTIGNRMVGLATLGPRLGFAVDRTLIYAKGGLAVAGFRGGVSVPGTDLRFPFARAGWFVGGGAEYAFAPNWSAKLEYNYVNLGTADAGFQSLGTVVVSARAKMDAHVVTAGINYRFTSGPSAVVARY